MTTPQIEVVDGGLHVRGDLTFATVAALLAASHPQFAGGSGMLAVNLAGVGRADSAGLALLIEWLRLAQVHGRELRFEAVPAQMQAIAVVSGLASVLPLVS